MAEEFISIIRKDKETSNEISNQILKLTSQSLATQSDAAKEFLKNNVILTKVVNYMGEAIGDMDIEIEEKDNKINFLKNKIGMSDKEITKEMAILKIRTSDVDINARIMKRLRDIDEKHKMLK
jgi:hypothetical protein